MDKNYEIARKLRKNSTKQEQKMWKLLRNRQFFNFKFKRQVPIGQYIADFICEERKIVLEIDGGQHNAPQNVLNDCERTKYFNSKGYIVHRFWNNDIDKNFEGVYLKLMEIFGVTSNG